MFCSWPTRIGARLVVTLALVGVAACGGAKTDAPADAAPTASAAADTATLSADAVAIAGFTLDTARTVAWQSAASAPARLMLDPAHVETLGSITEGRITHVLVRVGDVVRAGQVLVMIHSHEIMDARATLSRAQSQVTAATSERQLAVTAAERATRLFEAKAMSRADVERAETARITADAMYQQAVSEKERAEALVEHLVGTGPVPANADPHDVLIRSPIAGVVTGRVAEPGVVVLPGSPLITVGNPDRLVLQLRVSEAASQGIRVGALVRYSLTDDPTQPFEARVSRVAPTVDTLTRTIEVLATPTTRSRAVRAESFAQAEIVGVGGTPAVVVPVSAVQAMDGDTVVIAAEPRGEGMFIEAIPVRVGRRNSVHAELLTGIGVGRVVLVGSAAIAKAELLKRREAGEE
ncbi:MAG: efflux RND transporter periplasmic adaptor subunit [Gemmatimonadaceae bacterium]|nr:efflux RND transporter periplasmic adaptor subunit [Gemmatimonadaceae bacterium]